MIHVRASNIVRVRESGTGNMGDVTDPQSVARFSLPGGPFVLLSVRARFTLGTGTNTMTMRIDHPDETQQFDFIEDEWTVAGTTGKDNIRMVVPPKEWALYTYRPDSVLVFDWTNPDAATMRWALEVGMARAD